MKPSRAIKTIKEAVENGKAISPTMIKNGYKAGYAQHPDKFIATTTVQKWLAENYTDEMLAQVGFEGLKANKIHGTGDDFIEIADHDVRYKFWRDIAKARGLLGENERTNNTQVNINWGSGGYVSSTNIPNTKQPKRKA